MNVFARAVFSACLSVLLAQFAVGGLDRQANPAEACTGVGVVPLQVHEEPHAASGTLTSWLADRFESAACVPAQAAPIDHAPVLIATAATACLAAGRDPRVLLPPCRAPPTHS